MSSALDYHNPAQTPRTPLRERLNPRMLFFIALIIALVGHPVYVMIDMQVSGGVKTLAGGYKEVNLKAMSSFTFDQNNGTVEDVPQKWRELDKQKVVVEGEMWSPTGAGTTVDGFELVYSIAKCCFSGPPQIQHFV